MSTERSQQSHLEGGGNFRLASWSLRCTRGPDSSTSRGEKGGGWAQGRIYSGALAAPRYRNTTSPLVRLVSTADTAMREHKSMTPHL